MKERRVVIAVYPGAQTLDVSGPLEVFDSVNRLLSGDSAYRLQCVSPDAPSVPTSTGLVVQAEPLEAAEGTIDTLLVPGGPGLKQALRDCSFIAWIRSAAERSRRVASVCGGAFLLAEAGLLDGRRATTHWAFWEQMARRHPKVTVDPEPIFIRDGPYVTSAGVSTGIDMALALVEGDHGPDCALEIARFLVLYFKRPGGQAQYSNCAGQLFTQSQVRGLSQAAIPGDGCGVAYLTASTHAPLSTGLPGGLGARTPAPGRTMKTGAPGTVGRTRPRSASGGRSWPASDPLRRPALPTRSSPAGSNRRATLGRYGWSSTPNALSRRSSAPRRRRRGRSSTR
ncbi:AraC family transcriptional regulator [Streptomyces sp. NPDC003480]